MRNFRKAYVLFLVLQMTVYAYDMDPPNETVHQHLTKESQLIWNLITPEINNHLVSSIADEGINGNYDIDDDTITGSAEDDKGPEAFPFLFHFWEPDNPDTTTSGSDDYDDGLLGFGSSYRRAMNYWTTKVISLYLKGDIDQSYYYLGRVAHLLEDASQPSHIHNDAHLGHRLYVVCGGLNPDCDDSFFEKHEWSDFL